MQDKVCIQHPQDIAALLKKWSKKRQENFLLITLDGSHTVIRVHHITKGLVNRTLVHPRECFFPAIKDNATAVIFAHNHPSCHVDPSLEDEDMNKKLKMASEILGFHMMDNVIITKYGQFYSFRVNGKLSDEFSDEEYEDYTRMVAAENRKGDKTYEN